MLQPHPDATDLPRVLAAPVNARRRHIVSLIPIIAGMYATTFKPGSAATTRLVVARTVAVVQISASAGFLLPTTVDAGACSPGGIS